MKLIRPLAQAGNSKALNVLGVMYRKGEGVTPSSRPRVHVVQPCRQERRRQREGEPAGNVEGNEAG